MSSADPTPRDEDEDGASGIVDEGWGHRSNGQHRRCRARLKQIVQDLAVAWKGRQCDAWGALHLRPESYIIRIDGAVITRQQAMQPKEVKRLIQHRLAREAKVVSSIAQLGRATLDELVLKVYDDVPEPLRPLALRSLIAHLEKLAEDGRAGCSDGVWSLIR